MYNPVDRRLVVGAGWLGEPLAREWQDHGHKVVVTTRNEERIVQLQASGLQTWRLDLADAGESYGLEQRLAPFACICFAVPPARSSAPKTYAEWIARILRAWPYNPSKTVLFISSTGVYPPQTDEYDESSEVLVDHAVVLAEREVQQWGNNYRILRCGGLADERRVIARYWSGKVLEEADQPVNWVHRDDVIGALNFLEEQAISGIFNVVAPLHPERRGVARQQSERYGFAPPAHETEGGKRRIIQPKALLELGFVFKHPDPLSF